MNKQDLEYRDFVIQHTADYLSQLRKKAGVSQIELAQRLKKKIGFVMRTEDGREPVKVTDFLDIVAALDLDRSAAFKELVGQLEDWKRNKTG